MRYSDKYFMNLAISEAIKGDSDVYPNPRVGCVIVKDNKIIGSGYHKLFGSEHAEEVAIKSASKNLHGASIYITLEPCSHFGNRPPCTDLIIRNNFKKVVIGSLDPNPIANKGSEVLKASGIKVITGVCESESKKINQRFYTYYEKGRPYVILKFASTLDGFLAEKNGRSKWITGERARKSVHQLRSKCDAILVGSKTILNDNPELTSHGEGNDPKIVIINPNTSIPKNFKIQKNTPMFINDGLTNNWEKNISIILNKLKNKKIQTVLVEGGGKTISSFIESDIFDEIHMYLGPKFLGEGISFFNKISKLEDDRGLYIDKIENFEMDICIKYIRKY